MRIDINATLAGYKGIIYCLSGYVCEITCNTPHSCYELTVNCDDDATCILFIKIIMIWFVMMDVIQIYIYGYWCPKGLGYDNGMYDYLLYCKFIFAAYL